MVVLARFSTLNFIQSLGEKSISPQKDVLGLGRKSNTTKEKIQSIGKKLILRLTEKRLTT